MNGDTSVGINQSGATSGGSSGSMHGRLVSLDIGGLRQFDVQGDPHSLSQRWKMWKRSLILFAVGKGIKNDGQKAALQCRKFITR